MRLFFAVPIPDNLIQQVTAVQQQLRERATDDGIRWVRPVQYHYTLKFLGEQSFQRAETAVEAAEAIATEFGAFDFALKGIGAFPNANRPSTLWLGATEGAEQLAALAKRLDEVLARRGFANEKRPVKAHLTLARIKSNTGEAAVAQMLRSAPEADCGSFKIDRFVLMRSTLKPSGSEYSVLKEFVLTQPV